MIAQAQRVSPLRGGGTYDRDHDVGALSELRELLMLGLSADDDVHAELVLEDLRLLGRASEGGDLKGRRLGVREETLQDRGTDVACSKVSARQ